MKTHYFLAFDLGASSGRALLGSLNGEKLDIQEIHRFNNQMMLIHGHYFWNIYSLFNELKPVYPNAYGSSTFNPNRLE